MRRLVNAVLESVLQDLLIKIKRILHVGLWFTHAPLIKEIIKRGLDVIEMVKADKKLIDLIEDIAQKANKKITKLI